MRHFASTVPVMREANILIAEEGDPKEIKVEAPAFVPTLGPDDELWLMMGSTNAAVALGAFRQGVDVHQLSYARALPYVRAARNRTSDEDAKVKISAEDVYALANAHPDIFYPMYPGQGEVLDVISAWQQTMDAMKAREAYANLVRSRLQQQAVALGNAMSVKELAAKIEEQVGKKDPQDPGMQNFLSQEDAAEKVLVKALKNSELYKKVFEPIAHVGPKLAARFISAIERIERFETPKDLMRFAGMLPTHDGRLPSKRRGSLLSRSPELNNACFMLQEQMFKYGAKTEFGQILHDHVKLNCPCTEEERRADKELRAKHVGAVKQARIAMSRVFLEHIWNGWRTHMGL